MTKTEVARAAVDVLQCIREIECAAWGGETRLVHVVNDADDALVLAKIEEILMAIYRQGAYSQKLCKE